MPNSQVPVLEEWDQEAYLPDEVNEVLERYKNGDGLDTKMRQTDPALKSISDRKQTDVKVDDSENADD